MHMSQHKLCTSTSLHSRWNFFSTFTELRVHGPWPMEVTSNTYFRGVAQNWLTGEYNDLHWNTMKSTQASPLLEDLVTRRTTAMTWAFSWSVHRLGFRSTSCALFIALQISYACTDSAATEQQRTVGRITLRRKKTMRHWIKPGSRPRPYPPLPCSEPWP